MTMSHDILVRPLLSEKTVTLNELGNTVAFEVVSRANKVQIRKAVEDLFGVRVVGVRTAVVRGKSKRWGRWVGKRKNWKKAYVTLAAGDAINFFEGV